MSDRGRGPLPDGPLDVRPPYKAEGQRQANLQQNGSRGNGRPGSKHVRAASRLDKPIVGDGHAE